MVGASLPDISQTADLYPVHQLPTQSQSPEPGRKGLTFSHHIHAELGHFIPHSARALRKMYPGKSVLLSTDWNTNILGFPGAVIQPTSESDLITSVVFVPFARRLGQLPGVLMDQIKFGSFHVAWDVRIPMNFLS